MLGAIQNKLFDLGADLATPAEDFTPNEMALRVVHEQIDRLDATTGHVVTISGNAITNQVTCTGQQDTYALNVTLNQLGDNEFIIPAGGGLDTGMWVNHISATSGQFQHQQRPAHRQRRHDL